MNAKIISLVFLALFSFVPCMAQDYFPLKQGCSWEYLVDISKGNSSQTFPVMCKVLPQMNILLGPATPVQYQNGDVVFYVETDKAIVLVAKQSSSDLEPTIINYTDAGYNALAKKPVIARLGGRKMKTQFVGDYELQVGYEIDKLNETVMVPAGVFENCVRYKASGNLKSLARSQVTIEQYDWYAPNIGLVKGILTETIIPPAPYSKRTVKAVIQLTKFAN